MDTVGESSYCSHNWGKIRGPLLTPRFNAQMMPHETIQLQNHLITGWLVAYDKMGSWYSWQPSATTLKHLTSEVKSRLGIGAQVSEGTPMMNQTGRERTRIRSKRHKNVSKPELWDIFSYIWVKLLFSFNKYPVNKSDGTENIIPTEETLSTFNTMYFILRIKR